MRIAFVQAQTCLRTTKIARALKKQGIETHAITARISKQYEDGFTNVHLINAGTNSVCLFWDTKNLGKTLKNLSLDLVETENGADSTVLAVKYCLERIGKQDLKVCHNIHDLYSALHYSTKIHNYHSEIERLAFEKADALINVSEESEQLMTSKYPSLKDKKKIVFYTYPSIDDIPEQRLPKDSRADGKTHLVFAGATVNQSTYNDFSQEFSNIIKNTKDIKLHLYLSNNIILQPKTPRITMHYRLPRKDLIREITRYSCGLATYSGRIPNARLLDCGLNNKFFDYMIAGIPIAAGNYEAMARIVKSKKLGFVWSTYDELEEKAKEWQGITTETPQELLIENNIKKLISFYKSLI